MSRIVLPIALFVVLLIGSGCAVPLQQPDLLQADAPIFVPGNNEEVVWERVVDVIHDYRFRIARENKLVGMIETKYKVGASILEPWHRDSVGPVNRLESTFQSIRRRVNISIQRAEGGFLISVEAFKELEDLPGQASSSAGGATFQDNNPLQRDLNLVVRQSTPSGWIPLGRDIALEQSMLGRLQRTFAR